MLVETLILNTCLILEVEEDLPSRRSPTEPDWTRLSQHIVEPGYTLWTVRPGLGLVSGSRVYVEDAGCVRQDSVPVLALTWFRACELSDSREIVRGAPDIKTLI